MYLHNVTSIVEDDTVQGWLKWMNQIPIPQIMETQKFVSFRLLKVIDLPNEGQTFCVQYVVKHITDYQAYQKKNLNPPYKRKLKKSLQTDRLPTTP